MATSVARRPTTSPLASITTHFFVTSAGFAENVFICDIRKWKTARRARAELTAFLEKARLTVNKNVEYFCSKNNDLKIRFYITSKNFIWLEWNRLPSHGR